MKIWWCYSNLFKLNIWFICDCTHDEAAKWLNRKGMSVAPHSEARGCTWWTTASVCIVWVGVRSKGTLMHECIHATFDILKFRGISPDDSTELFCCFSQYLFETFSKFRNLPKGDPFNCTYI